MEKELVRVREDSLAVLGEEEIIKKFPRTMYLEDASTVIVLKTPKTESSVRKVWMPKTVAYILREWKASQDKQKEFLGSEYLDYNLVVALPNGRPCEETVISNAFRRLKRDAQLPDVVFHSLRHSSTTYKLKLNHGDIKATQGDTGHSQADMVTKVYAHILDEDRKVNAQKFESAFYANLNFAWCPSTCRASARLRCAEYHLAASAIPGTFKRAHIPHIESRLQISD